MSKLILTDADGVLVSWVNGFHTWMKSKGYSIISDESYWISDNYGISPTEGKKLCYEFSHTENIMTLKPFEDAKIYLPKIHEEFGYKFRVITSLSDSPMVQRWRKANLESIFGPIFDEIICLSHGNNKHTTLVDYEGSNLIWVEDKVENAELGASLGLNSFLINRPYNQYSNNTYYEYNRIYSWEEIYQFLLSSET